MCSCFINNMNYKSRITIYLLRAIHMKTVCVTYQNITIYIYGVPSVSVRSSSIVVAVQGLALAAAHGLDPLQFPPCLAALTRITLLTHVFHWFTLMLSVVYVFASEVVTRCGLHGNQSDNRASGLLFLSWPVMTLLPYLGVVRSPNFDMQFPGYSTDMALNWLHTNFFF
jgi:hypothetical protein